MNSRIHIWHALIVLFTVAGEVVVFCNSNPVNTVAVQEKAAESTSQSCIGIVCSTLRDGCCAFTIGSLAGTGLAEVLTADVEDNAEYRDWLKQIRALEVIGFGSNCGFVFAGFTLPVSLLWRMYMHLKGLRLERVGK